MNWIEEASIHKCPYRGQEIARERCSDCSAHVKLKRYECVFSAKGATFEECSACHVPKLHIPAPLPDARLLFWVQFPGYRERHTTFFLAPLAQAGWNVIVLPADRAVPLHGVAEAARKHGIPDAVVQWEEHGCARTDAAWRQVITWCYAHGALPLSVDFGYVSHYEQFMFDRYLPDGTSAIDVEWATVPTHAPRWEDGGHIVRERHRRVLRGYEEARAQPSLVEGRYVALWLQQYPTLCRLDGAAHHNDLVARIAAELRTKGLRLVVKTAPSTPEDRKLTEWSEDVQVFRHEEVPADTNQRLAVHAEYCLVVSSSITNEFVQAGLPVVALGRSWFNDKGVFYEPSRWEQLPNAAPAVDEAARNRYLNWWLGRQCASTEAGAALDALCRRTVSCVTGSAVTCVYAPDGETEAMARRSLASTAQALPDWRLIAAVDAASPACVVDLVRDNVEVIALADGAPPRMGRLLAEAVARANGEFLFTVEHDVILNAVNASKAIEMLRALPARVAGLYIQSVDEAGEPNYPWTSDWPKAQPFDANGRFRVPRWPTLSCTLWRRGALAHIDWARVPALEFVDGAIGDQLRATGYLCLMTTESQAMHFPHTGRRCMAGQARTLAIGCGNNLWAQRGIRVAWDDAPSDLNTAVRGCLPLDDDSCREIYVCGEIHEWSEQDRCLFIREAWRVLRDGGRFELFDAAAESVAIGQGERVRLWPENWNIVKKDPKHKRAHARKP